MIQGRSFLAFITEKHIGSANLTFGEGRADLLKKAIADSAIDDVKVVLYEDNTIVVETIPAAFFNQFVWHKIQNRDAIDMRRVRQKMRAK